MKLYFDVGLKEVARVSGNHVVAIQKCCQFKCTHNFIIEAWQAVYLVRLQQFTECGKSTGYMDIVNNASINLRSTDFKMIFDQLRDQLQNST